MFSYQLYYNKGRDYLSHNTFLLCTSKMRECFPKIIYSKHKQYTLKLSKRKFKGSKRFVLKINGADLQCIKFNNEPCRWYITWPFLDKVVYEWLPELRPRVLVYYKLVVHASLEKTMKS